MTSFSRRTPLASLATLLAAPAVIRTPHLLMPIKRLPPGLRLFGDGVNDDVPALNAMIRGERVLWGDRELAARLVDGVRELRLPSGMFFLSEAVSVSNEDTLSWGMRTRTMPEIVADGERVYFVGSPNALAENSVLVVKNQGLISVCSRESDHAVSRYIEEFTIHPPARDAERQVHRLYI